MPHTRQKTRVNNPTPILKRPPSVSLTPKLQCSRQFTYWRCPVSETTAVIGSPTIATLTLSPANAVTATLTATDIATTSTHTAAVIDAPATALSLKLLDERLSKQSATLIEALTNEINKLREDVERRLSELSNFWSSQLESVTSTVSDIVKRVESIEANNENGAKAINEKINVINLHIDALQRKEFAADAVLFGVPQLNDENVLAYFNTLCNALHCEPPTMTNIFHVQQRRNHNSRTPPPIILQFPDQREKNSLLRAAAQYRKEKQKELCLRDLGISSNASCYINESLTEKNREILRSAVQLKKKKKLSSVYSMTGLVHVKLRRDGRSYAIQNLETLNAITEQKQNEYNNQ